MWHCTSYTGVGYKISSSTREWLRQRDNVGGKFLHASPDAGGQDICHAWAISDQVPADPWTQKNQFIASVGIRSTESLSVLVKHPSVPLKGPFVFEQSVCIPLPRSVVSCRGCRSGVCCASLWLYYTVGDRLLIKMLVLSHLMSLCFMSNSKISNQVCAMVLL